MSPWTAKSFRERHNKKLTLSQAKLAARVANKTLKETGDEKKAVISGNVAAKRGE